MYVCNSHRLTLRLRWRIITQRENSVSVILMLCCFQELRNITQANVPHQSIYLYFAFLPLYCVTAAIWGEGEGKTA